MNYENYPALPEGILWAREPGGLDLAAAKQVVREAQKEMARECWKVLRESGHSFGANHLSAKFLEERFGPFDE